MNANRLRKKNKLNGLAPTFRRKMEYIAIVDRVSTITLKHKVSVFNWEPYTLIAESGWLPRVNNEID